MSSVSQTGSTCVANTWIGIGKDTCRNLLKRKAKVYLAARSKDKALQAIKDLEEETGRAAIFLQLDLSDLASVKKAAQEYQRCIMLRIFASIVY